MRSVNHSAGRFRKHELPNTTNAANSLARFSRSCSLGRPLAVEKKKMNNNDQITLVEIRERLVRIETILEEQDYKAVCKTADDALAIAKNNAEEIAKLQNILSWVIRAIIGAVISAIMAFILIK
jgi:dsRNA-specific ribonuclease